jgi:hypothetical protein
MGGDLLQWNEAKISGTDRGLRGGSWYDNYDALQSTNRYSNDPSDAGSCYFGFRVASSAAVPEPGSIALLLAGAVALGIWRRRWKA